MVNLKTKNEKHANDNEKRCKSIKEKEKAKFNQSKIIQQALSNSSLGNNSSKKIIFGDENGNTTSNKDGSRKESNNSVKFTLFDGSDSENETFEIKEKTQFTGKKGFELLNLQSTYGNDERFKIDERFLEDDEDYDEDEKKNIADAGALGEKSKQLKILEDVLGTSVVRRPEKEKKVKKRTYEMIRYDVANKDHEIYEKNIQNKSLNLVPSKKRKENRKTQRTEKDELSKPKVSKDKFYEVSSEIKNRFKEKEDEKAQFSLLQTYGSNGVEKDQEFDEEEIEKKKDVGKFTESDLEINEAPEKEYEINRNKPDTEEKSVVAKGIWIEPFFFVEDDARFKEGLDFINKKDSPEAIEAAENYDKTRKILKEILRLHLKKQVQKKDPFRNKIGGMNKKQLASSRSKNPKTLFNKNKTAKVNLKHDLISHKNRNFLKAPGEH